jgi:hypothetical protein
MRYDPSNMLIILSMLRFSMFWIVTGKLIFGLKKSIARLEAAVNLDTITLFT